MLTTIVAASFGGFGYLDALERKQAENRTLATEFLASHGTITCRKMGNYWDLSGIADLEVDELNLLRYLDSNQRERIISIDLSDSNVTDRHLAFIDCLPLLHQIDLRETNVTRSVIGRIYTSPRFRKTEIFHDFEGCYWFQDGSWVQHSP